MTAFRILNPFPAYLDLIGMPASGGSLKFYQSGTDTPKDVFGDPDLTVNNGPSVLIGTDGRTVVDVWGDGEYRVRLYAADMTLIAEADDVTLPGGTGAAIPALQDGQFLTSDGAVLQWQEIRQVPDPTGNSGKILGTDGVNLLWQAAPTVPTPTTGVGQFNFGGLLIQWGTGTAPASGTQATTQPISFVTAFSGLPVVFVNPTSSINPAGLIGAHAAWGISSAGFTAEFSANIDNTGSQFTIAAPIPFSWLAVGQAPA
jgi:hypothetical protein